MKRKKPEVVILNARLPEPLHRQLVEAGRSKAPVPSSINTEIIERLTASFGPTADDGEVWPMEHLQTLIDPRRKLVIFEIKTEHGVFRFAFPADGYAELAKALARDVPVVEATLAHSAEEAAPAVAAAELPSPKKASRAEKPRREKAGEARAAGGDGQ